MTFLNGYRRSRVDL